MIDVSCLCGKSFRAPPELAGKQVNCPSCGQAFVVPSAQPAANDPFVVDLSSFEDQSAPAAADDPLGLGAAAAPIQQLPQQQTWAGGYDQPLAQPQFASPRPTKARRPGSGKTGFYVAVVVGSLVGIGALIGIIVLIMSLIGSPHERLVNKAIKITERMVSALEDVKDEASADRAVAVIKDCAQDLKAVAEKARTMKNPSPEVMKRIETKFRDKTKSLQKRIQPAMTRIASQPALRNKLTSAMLELGSAFTGFGGMGRSPIRPPRVPTTPGGTGRGVGSMPGF